jgi:protein SCO1/2
MSVARYRGKLRLAVGAWMLAVLTGTMLAATAPGWSMPADTAASATRFGGFVDQSGRAFAPARLAGKAVLLNFIFAGCGTTCPVQTAELAATLKAMPPSIRRSVRIVSITVDPANDTPVALRRYAEARGIRGGEWAFLTGDPAGMMRLARIYNAVGTVNGRVAESMHSTDVVLLNGAGRTIRRYRALPLDKARVIQDVEMLTQFPLLQRR